MDEDGVEHGQPLAGADVPVGCLRRLGDDDEDEDAGAHAVSPAGGLQRRVAREHALLQQEERRAEEALQKEENLPAAQSQ